MFDMRILESGREQRLEYGRCSRVMTKDEMVRELARGDRIPSHLWSKITRRCFWTKLRFREDTSCGEDYRILHQVVIDMQSFAYLHAPLYCYVQQPGSIVHCAYGDLRNVAAFIGYARERRDFLRAHGYDVSDCGVVYTEYMYLLNVACGWSSEGHSQSTALPLKSHKVLSPSEGEFVVDRATYDACLRDVRRHLLMFIATEGLAWRHRVGAVLIVCGAGSVLPWLRCIWRRLRF